MPKKQETELTRDFAILPDGVLMPDKALKAHQEIHHLLKIYWRQLGWKLESFTIKIDKRKESSLKLANYNSLIMNYEYDAS